jgi:hypothetical protein
MQQAASLSFWRLQTLIRPSAFEIQKRDSSENNTSCHLCLVHCKWVLAHAKRCWRCRGVSSGPLNDRLARRPFSCSLRCTVAELIRGLCLPGVSLAVDAAVLKRLRKCYSRIWRSCWSVVTLGCPGRGRSDTLFVVWNLCLRRTTVLWWQLNCRATSLVDMPALNIPIAWLRSLLLRRGIFETQ